MTRIKKILAAITVSVLLLLGGVATAAPATAAYGNSVGNNSARSMMTFVGDSGLIFSVSAGQRAYNVKYIIVPAGRCISVSWTLAAQCASSSLSKRVFVGDGYHGARLYGG